MNFLSKHPWLRKGILFVSVIVGLFAILFNYHVVRGLILAFMEPTMHPNPYSLTEEQIDHLKKVYKPTARKELYRRIDRKHVRELEPLLAEILPLLKPVPGLNLTNTFSSFHSNMDMKLQRLANSTNLTQEDFRTLSFYETVQASRDRHATEETKEELKEYMKYKLPARARNVSGVSSDWKLTAGRLRHRSLDKDDDPLSLRFLHRYHIRITGLFYYPPGGYAEWHTNKYDLTGWRMYYIKTTEPDKSWFRYKHVKQDTFHIAPDITEHYNMFYLEGGEDNLIWHSVYSDTHRFSIGFNVPPIYAYLILSRLNPGQRET